MKLQQIKYLLAIADNGLNITTAAEQLFTSQPGVSKQLKMLEQELKLQLFTRKGKSLEDITPAGQRVIERCRVILQAVDNIRNLASDYYEQEEGTLSIGTTHTQARYVLPAVVKLFRERYPEVKLELHQGTSEQIADMVNDKTIDLAIATGSQSLFRNLLLLPVYHWHRTILVPKQHELTTLKRKLTLQDLAEHPLVTYVFSFSGESSLKKAFMAEGLKPDVVFTARDADVIKTYVRMGMGVGIVASMAHQADADKYLIAISAEGLFPRSTSWIGLRKDAVLRRYMQDFIHLFAPHFSRNKIVAASQSRDQTDVEHLFRNTKLPVRRDSSEGAPAIA